MWNIRDIKIFHLDRVKGRLEKTRRLPRGELFFTILKTTHTKKVHQPNFCPNELLSS
jgi:hypothetical protein